jgi:hypothetical protein
VELAQPRDVAAATESRYEAEDNVRELCAVYSVTDVRFYREATRAV